MINKHFNLDAAVLRQTRAWALGLTLVVSSGSALFATPALAQDSSASSEVDNAVWDLSAFYASKADWEAELERLRGEVKNLSQYQGKLGESAKNLLSTLDAQSTFYKELLRVWSYASNLRNTNLGDPEGQAMVGTVRALFQTASAAQSFFAPEIVQLGERRIEKLIKKEPGLEKHALSLRNTLRKGEHVLSPETEQALSLMSSALSASQSARDVLANAEIEWPRITLSDGTEAHLNNAGYVLHRAAPERKDRIAVFDAFWSRYKDFESTFGVTLNGEVQANVAMSKARKYDNTLQYFLSGDNIPESGSAYDVHPLILLNHQDTYNSASTYAHEWGHAMHQVLTNENQPYELADQKERLFYLGYALEQMRGTFYRQVMFSEFELAIHEEVEQGKALTGARMTELYGEILKRYHGHEQGVMKITDKNGRRRCPRGLSRFS